MSCEWLDGDAALTAPAAEIDAHLAGCAECRKGLDDLGRIATRIARGHAAYPLPDEFQQRTLRRIRDAQAGEHAQAGERPKADEFAQTDERSKADEHAQAAQGVDSIERARRKRRTAFAGFAAAAAAAAIAVLLWPPRRDPAPGTQIAQRDTAPAEPRLALEIRARPGWRGADSDTGPGSAGPGALPGATRPPAHVGQELRAQAAPAGAAHFAVRIYRDSRAVVAACPDAGPPICTAPDGAQLAWTLPTVGSYQVVFLVSPQPIPGPRGSLDDDVAAASAAGARVVAVETVDVR